MTLNLQKRLLTVEEYQKMGEAGILTPEDRVELINGEILEMSPIKSKHTSTVKRITALLYSLVSQELIISVQDPIAIDQYSEPEPDIALLKPSDDFYASGHPRPDDVILVLEVSDATLLKDQTLKLGLYASAGIPNYWIVNLIDNRVEVYSNPHDGIYKSRLFMDREEILSIPNTEVDIKPSKLLP